jgi:hypothetical protein
MSFWNSASAFGFGRKKYDENGSFAYIPPDFNLIDVLRIKTASLPV